MVRTCFHLFLPQPLKNQLTLFHYKRRRTAIKPSFGIQVAAHTHTGEEDNQSMNGLGMVNLSSCLSRFIKGKAPMALTQIADEPSLLRKGS